MRGQILKVVVCFLIVICALIPTLEAKRSFGITGRRSKSKQHSVRRGSHAHSDYDMGPVPGPKDSVPKPSAPDSHSANKPIGWNVNNNNQHGATGHHNSLSASHNQPMGPPPPYPGMGHNPVPGHGGPPGYYQSFSGPPGYSSFGHGPAPKNTFSYGQNYGQARGGQFAQSSSYYGLGGGHHSPSYTPQQSPYSGNHVGGVGNSGMFGGMSNGAMPAYGYGYGHHQQSSPFSLRNIIAGVALWQVARHVGGGHHDTHHYHHYDKHSDQSQVETLTTTAAPLPPNLQLAEYQNVDNQNRYGQSHINYPMPPHPVMPTNLNPGNPTDLIHHAHPPVSTQNPPHEKLMT